MVLTKAEKALMQQWLDALAVQFFCCGDLKRVANEINDNDLDDDDLDGLGNPIVRFMCYQADGRVLTFDENMWYNATHKALQGHTGEAYFLCSFLEEASKYDIHPEPRDLPESAAAVARELLRSRR